MSAKSGFSIDAMLTAAVKEAIREAVAEWGAPQLLLTVEQAAQMLSYSKDFLFSEIAAGRIATVGERRALRVERAELDRYIAENRRRNM